MRLFTPREPVVFVPPKEHTKHGGYSGVAAYLSHFENAEADRAAREAAAAKPHVPTLAEQREARRRQHEAENNALIAKQLGLWDPKAYSPAKDGVTYDPYRTLFVYRLVSATSHTNTQATPPL